jgi:SAM-dependent methyltransferase
MSREPENSTAGNSELYAHSGHTPFASRLSQHVRRMMFQQFMDYFQPDPHTTVLDVGVTSDTTFAESNYLEKFYPYPNQITCVGTEDGSHLTGTYPGLSYSRVTAGKPLPFQTARFDIAFSNAVVEHTGDRSAQAAFVHEVCRVAKAFFITTPSRWFPVEHHTGLPFLHYLPAPVFRALLRPTPYRQWADENTLNILTAREFRRLFPPDLDIEIRTIRLAGFPSNMIALGRRSGR